MKKIYSLYAMGIGLVLASAIVLVNPPIAFAASCNANCEYGSNVYVSGSSCSCTDNVGCTFTNSQGTFTQNCAKKGDDELLLD
jgi:hypothetical protein